VIRALALVLACISLAGCGTTTSGSCAILTSCGVPAPTSLTVFAAASLQSPFNQVATRLKDQQNISITFNYAGSQTLTAQLTQGAPADLFASADTAHMTTIQNAGLTAATPQIFAHNSLEIAVAPGNPKDIHGLADLARNGLVVVLADPSVPAGKYAQQALAKAHVTVHPASLEPQVTGVLSKITLGEADAGIVYASDIKTSTKVAGVAIPTDQNVVADYSIAALKNASNPSGANTFLDFVLGPAGQSILKQAGFGAA
jgi:molybdate transport system substrate-binding protein